jgi:hypothetical protein
VFRRLGLRRAFRGAALFHMLCGSIRMFQHHEVEALLCRLSLAS